MARKVFEPMNITTTDLQSGGYCAADADSRLLVYGSLPGEQMTVMPFTRKQRKTFARPIEIATPSENRVTPPCAVADLCGGCSLQHMDPVAQVSFKQTQVQLEFADNQPLIWYPPLLGDVEHYRAKARLGVKFVDKKDKVLVGFREKLKPYIVETDRCHVLKAPVGDLLAELAILIEGLSVAREIPQIEVAMGDDITALVFRHLAPLTTEDEIALMSFGDLWRLHIYLQPGKPESITKLYPDDGNPFLEYSLPDLNVRYQFLPLDFTQVNPAINRQLIPRALALLELKKSDIVFDAFCGIGNFSLAMARQVEHVIGVENSEPSVERARHNADLNGITNCVFIAQDLFAESLEFRGFQDVNKVLIDPPRTGAEALCKKLASRKVERVVYVSCNPVTLARDAKILVQNGYHFDGAGVVDMFPHTTHVESIASFSL
ncbi:MAG: 23S rRNA (uracil1939-C5)-methyltransferase [Candidatus Azotimanducaceae bacterium]|jgi:23S rRNA (uracil1939-C5)-methyltransferase